ncbi:MAG: hypothetical protein ACTHZ5_14825, partial [Micrococcaceae bacterium]
PRWLWLRFHLCLLSLGWLSFVWECAHWGFFGVAQQPLPNKSADFVPGENRVYSFQCRKAARGGQPGKVPAANSRETD